MDDVAPHLKFLKTLTLSEAMLQLARQISTQYGFQEKCCTLALCLTHDILEDRVLEVHSLVAHAEGMHLDYTNNVDRNLLSSIAGTSKRSRIKLLLTLISIIDNSWVKEHKTTSSFLTATYQRGSDLVLHDVIELLISHRFYLQ